VISIFWLIRWGSKLYRNQGSLFFCSQGSRLERADRGPHRRRFWYR
jgi:hypothetical protein